MCGCIPAPVARPAEARWTARHLSRADTRHSGGLGPWSPGRRGSPLGVSAAPTQGALCCFWLAASSPRAGTGCRFLRRFLRSRKLECQSCAQDFLGLLALTVTNDSNLCIHFWSPMDRIDIIANSSLSGYGWNILLRTHGRKRVSQG